jgi:hypothetical protein
MYFLCNNCLHLVAFAFMTCAITCFEDLVALVFVFFSCYFSPTFWYPIIYFCGKNLCCGCKFCLLFFRLFFCQIPCRILFSKIVFVLFGQVGCMFYACLFSSGFSHVVADRFASDRTHLSVICGKH